MRCLNSAARFVLICSILWISCGSICCGRLEAEDRPNVLLIVADNLGHGDLSCYGCPDIQTPNIDSIARQGVRFTNFYSNGPECSPTRTALFTGRYQQRIGGMECALGSGNVGRYDDAFWLADQGQLGLPPQESTLIHAAQERRLQDGWLWVSGIWATRNTSCHRTTGSTTSWPVWVAPWTTSIITSPMGPACFMKITSRFAAMDTISPT